MDPDCATRFRAHAATLLRVAHEGDRRGVQTGFFWAYKPYVILEKLLRVPEGDWVLYQDASRCLRQGRGLQARALGETVVVR